MPEAGAEETEKKESKNELKLGGNIALVGFGALEPAELVVVKKIAGNYIRMMAENGGYKEARLTLQRHQKGNQWLHEIDGQAIFAEGKFGATVSAWNLYSALAEVCEKILEELRHRAKKEQRHERPPKGELPEGEKL